MLDRFPDGTYFVSLAPLQAVESVVPAVTSSLGLSLSGGAGALEMSTPTVSPRQHLLDYLRQKRLLLVMDNYEHLLDGAGLITDALGAAPGVKVIATSRATLNLPGEHLFPVNSLGLPEIASGTLTEWHVVAADTQSSAVRLFVSAAQRAWPDFELTPENLPHVIRVCRLVAGMPLGILLAAAWARMLRPAEIAAELGQGLDFLQSDGQGVPERQRSMRSVLDHSWRLLTDRQQEVLAGLSVFRGSFTRQAARQVVGATLRELMGLVNKSLLGHTPGQRYELHELLRQYAAEKLAQTADGGEGVRDRHIAHYVAAMEGWAAELQSARHAVALAEMATEIENVRTAWQRAVRDVQAERLCRAAEAMGRYHYHTHGRQEGEAAFRVAAAALEEKAKGPDGPGALLLRAWIRSLMWQAQFQGDDIGEGWGPLVDKLSDLLERPQLADQDMRREQAFVLKLRGSRAGHLDSDPKTARRLWERSLALFEAVGDRWAMGEVMPALGGLEMKLGHYDQAQRWYEKSLGIGRHLGDFRRVGASLGWLSWLALLRGQLEEAEKLARESSAVSRERLGEIIPRFFPLMFVLPMCGRFTEARSHADEILLALQRGQEAPWYLPWTRALLGFAKLHLGQYGLARASATASLTVSQGFQAHFRRGLCLCVLGQVGLAEGANDQAQEAFQKGAAVHHQAGRPVDRAEALAYLAYTERGLEHPEQARAHLGEALRVGLDARAFFPCLYALPALALLLADQGEAERAAELYALASRYPPVANSRWFEDVAGRHIAAAAESLSPEALAAAQERGRARDLWDTARELLAELEEQES
jgi:predicted ATPase